MQDSTKRRVFLITLAIASGSIFCVCISCWALAATFVRVPLLFFLFFRWVCGWSGLGRVSSWGLVWSCVRCVFLCPSWLWMIFLLRGENFLISHHRSLTRLIPTPPPHPLLFFSLSTTTKERSILTGRLCFFGSMFRLHYVFHWYWLFRMFPIHNPQSWRERIFLQDDSRQKLAAVVNSFMCLSFPFLAFFAYKKPTRFLYGMVRLYSFFRFCLSRIEQFDIFLDVHQVPFCFFLVVFYLFLIGYGIWSLFMFCFPRSWSFVYWRRFLCGESCYCILIYFFSTCGLYSSVLHDSQSPNNSWSLFFGSFFFLRIFCLTMISSSVWVLSNVTFIFVLMNLLFLSYIFFSSFHQIRINWIVWDREWSFSSKCCGENFSWMNLYQSPPRILLRKVLVILFLVFLFWWILSLHHPFWREMFVLVSSFPSSFCDHRFVQSRSIYAVSSRIVWCCYNWSSSIHLAGSELSEFLLQAKFDRITSKNETIFFFPPPLSFYISFF